MWKACEEFAESWQAGSLKVKKALNKCSSHPEIQIICGIADFLASCVLHLRRSRAVAETRVELCWGWIA